VFCPVCGELRCLPVADFPFNDGRRPAMTPLYICIVCGSAHFRHAPREGSTLQWHQKVYDRNMAWSATLYEKLRTQLELRSVIDIGCGIGTWLNYVKGRGGAALGFDTAEACVAHGRQAFGLDLRAELFEASHPAACAAAAELLSCIMVMEHLPQPRLLAREMAAYCRRHGSLAYVSVPFFNDRRFLDFDSESAEYNVFNDVGAHVTYFSDEGMIRMFAGFGLKLKLKLSIPAWRGLLFEAVPAQFSSDRHDRP
jgi:SAM-dependent methyltransferase